MLHTDVSDEADSDLSLNHSGCGSSDQSHDLFLQPNYKAACTLVIPVLTIQDHQEEGADSVPEMVETCDLFHGLRSVLLPRQICVDEPSLVVQG